MNRILIGIAGIAVILALALLLSTNRRAIRLRVVGAAFALQVGIAVLVLYVPAGKSVLAFLSGGVANLLGYAKAGVDFLFGPLATPEIGGNSFAIAALPVIIFFASLVSILYYLGVMQLVVRWLGGGIEKV
ncbi:MAG: NupC/NupG family nucleoside CNT transporter, partial [Sphingomonas bacterium]|nr:NupC/NupG family nucleoside CNT transporter [Sphingomonas bacterium]